INKLDIAVTIIMPVYNVELYLKRSIESIINQSFFNWELIIVNDGSTDNSPKIIDMYKKMDNRINIIQQKNQGAGVARQKALEKAQGKYICFVDPDDYLEETALSSNYKIAEKHATDIIVNGYAEINETGSKNYYL